MKNIDDEFRAFLKGIPKNSQHFKVGDCVMYYVYPLEITSVRILKRHQSNSVKAEVHKVNSDGTYDITKSQPPFDVETNWPEESLFPCNE